MSNYNLKNHFGSIKADEKHDKLYDSISKILSLNNKAVFIMLAQIGLSKDLDISKTICKQRGHKEIRSFTDTKLNYYIYAMMVKLILKDSNDINEVFGNTDRFKEYLDQVIKYSYEGAEYLLNNELVSYKTGVVKSSERYFILDIFSVLSSVSKDLPF